METKSFEEMTKREIALNTIENCAIWESSDLDVWKGLSEYRIYSILRDYNPYLDNPMDYLEDRAKAVFLYVNGML